MKPATRERRAAALAAVALVMLAAMAGAQIPQKMNYQVMLTDDADQPLADQPVVMVFAFYAASSGGSALWTETQNPTTNSIGVVSVILGAVNPIDVPFDAPRWLEVEVNGETLTPRREIVTAPYAGRAATADDSDKLGDIDASEYALLTDLVGTGDGHSLDADDGAPVDALYVDANGDVGIGTTSPEAELHVEGGMRVQSEGLVTNLWLGAGDPVVDGIVAETSQYHGGSIDLKDEGGAPGVSLGALSHTGGGGYLQLFRDESSNVGIGLFGNNYGNGEPTVWLQGTSRSAEFNMSLEGNSSVDLPDEAIDSRETLDEPGVASVQAMAWITPSSTNIFSIAARMISVPANGYVFAMGTAQVQLMNSPASAHSVLFGVSRSLSAWSAESQEAYIAMPNGLPQGNYDHHVAVSGLFAVYEGNHTFYLNIQKVEGNMRVRSRQLTLMYFPTAHGTVDLDE